MPLGENGIYLPILKKLEANGLIRDFAVTDHGTLCSFRFASKEILLCIQSSGSILEHYIYYSALLDGHFDDVEMGWQFLHSAGEASARNEIDVICTKGMTSLFISAKMLTRANLRANNHLNYILYEISLLADRFGIHAKPVPVAPALEQFQTNPQTGRSSAAWFNWLCAAAYIFWGMRASGRMPWGRFLTALLMEMRIGACFCVNAN